MTQQRDLLVEEYLSTVAAAGADLPAHRRDDLLSDLSQHIASARADLTPETEAGVRTILARLGDPGSIVAEARLGITPLPAPLPPPAWPAPSSGPRGTPGWVVAVVITAAVVFLACAGVVVVGWAAAVQGRTELPLPAAPTSIPQPSLSPS